MIRISISKELAMADGNRRLQVDTSIEKGSLTAVFGKSGAGKTSMLRIIAGLLKPESGTIVSGEDVWLDTDRKINIPVQKRKIGFVFQDLALFPNMTVYENLRYGIRGDGQAADIARLLEMTGLEQLRDRKPDTLSGGQRQRIAICRALVGRPDLLLLDEPFSSLDADMHQQLREDLLRFHRSLNLTILLVTHDLADAYGLADKVIVIDSGEVVKSGTPSEVFDTRQSADMLQLQGEILRVCENGVVGVAEVLAGNKVIRVLVSDEEKARLKAGMKVLVCSGSFDPVIRILS